MFGGGQGVEPGKEVEIVLGQPVLEQLGKVLAGDSSG